MTRVKNKKILSWHQAVACLFVFLLTGSFLFGKNALALTGDYNKAVNGSLSAVEWNNLINDFVVVRTGGLVGIGTASPALNLDVVGRGVFGNMAASRGSYGNTLNLSNSNGTDTSLFLWQSGIASGHIGFSASSNLLRIVNSTSDGSLTNAASINLTTTGFVGIGTTAPNDILSLGNGGSSAPAGSSNTGHNFTNTYLSADKYALANYGLVETLISNATSTMPTLWSGTLSGNIWNGNSGNVGVGTNNPDSLLTVINKSAITNSIVTGENIGALSTGTTANGFGVAQLFTLQDAGGSGIWTNKISSSWIDASAANRYARLDFWSSKNNSRSIAMSIDQNGLVGIGTTAPAALLHVNGNSRFDGTMSFRPAGGAASGFTSSIGISDATNFQGVIRMTMAGGSDFWQLAGTGVSDNGVLEISTGDNGVEPITFVQYNGATGTERMRIHSNGYVGVGTAVPNDIFSIGSAGSAAPSGSVNTGHNFTNTYLSTDDYALVNYGLMKTLIYNATSTLSTTSKYIGTTANSYTGNNTGTGGNVPGYTKANSICAAEFSGSHVCLTYELLYTIATNSTMPTEPIVWIFNGPPGYIAEANDCDGRAKNASTSYGAVWQTDTNKWVNGRGMLTACNNANKFACCK